MAFSVGQLSAGISADQSGFNAAMREVKSAGAKTASDISQKFREVGQSMQDIGKTLSMKLTAPLVALGGASVKAFDTQIQAEKRLEAALRSGGEEVQNNIADFKAYAAQLQSVSTVGDESTLQLLQVAKSMGLTNDQAKRAAKNSISLAKAMGMSEQSAIRYTSALESGESTMLARYIPALRQIDDKSARAAKAQELLANMWGAVTAEAQNGLGPLTQMWNTLGDFSEQIGDIVLKRMQPFIDAIGQTVNWMKSLDQGTKEMIVTVGTLAAGIGPLLFGLGGIIKLLPILTTGFFALTSPISIAIGAISALAAIGAHLYQNWDAVKDQLNYVWLNMKNAVVEFVADTIDVLTTLYQYIPGVGAAIDSATSYIRSFKSEIPDAADVKQFKSWESTMKGVLNGVTGMFGDAKTKIVNDTKAIADAGKKAGEAARAAIGGGGSVGAIQVPIEIPKDQVINEVLTIEEMTRGIDLSLPDKLFPPGSLGALAEKMMMLREQMQYATDPAQIALFKEQLSLTTQQMDAITGATNNAANAGSRWGSSLGDAFSQTLFHGKKLLESVKDMVKQFAKKVFIKGITAILTGGSSLAGGGLVSGLIGGIFHGGGIVPGQGNVPIMAQGGEGVFTKRQMAAMGSLQPRRPSAGISERSLQGAFRRALESVEIRTDNEGLYLAVQKGKRGY